jgi:Cof subfamily protein (haloacid dehalogenase superfamily)
VGYELVVFDLDGTLIGDTVTIDPGLRDALTGASRRGLRITIATGRMPAAVEPYRAELGIRTPMIFYNGALIRDVETGADLFALHLPRGILGRAWPAIAEAPVHPLFFRDDRVYCADRTPPIREYCEEQGLRVHVVDDPADFLRQGAFVKSLLIGPPPVLDVLRPSLEAVVADEARLLRTRGHYLELVPPAASKGDALARLARYLEVPMEKIVAVGDQENDLEMLRAAGLGIAMPHAPEPVRRAADRVVPPAEAGGLLGLLRELLPAHVV